MKIKILGCSGGHTEVHNTTSFLINDSICVDAGSITSCLNLESQSRIEHVFLSHAHLDHISSLPFLIDNCFDQFTSRPLFIYGSIQVIQSLKKHLFNDEIWPDFTKIPTVQRPCIQFIHIQEEVPINIGEVSLIPISVNHTNGSFGYIINDKISTCIFTLDTGKTNRIWNISKTFENISAIFTEVSLPNEQQDLAYLSRHLTPSCLGEEILKMPVGVPIFIGHLKPNYYDIIKKQLTAVQYFSRREISLLSDRQEITT